MSRATDQSRVYIDTLDHDPRTNQPRTPQQQYNAAVLDFYDMAMRSDAQTLARDHGRPIDPQHLDRNDLRRAITRQQLAHAQRSAVGYGHQRAMPQRGDELTRGR